MEGKKPSPIGEYGNKYGIGNNGGQPPKYDSPEAMGAEIDAYFHYCEGEYIEEEKEIIHPRTKEPTIEKVKTWIRYPEPPTVTGLTLYLGFAHRQSLSDYEEKTEFTDIIRRAKMRVEHSYEKRLYHDRPTGAIFALSNMGWRNSHAIDHTSKGEKIGSADLSAFSDDDLLKLTELQRKARGE